MLPGEDLSPVATVLLTYKPHGAVLNTMNTLTYTYSIVIYSLLCYQPLCLSTYPRYTAALSCYLIGVEGEPRWTTKACCSRNDHKVILLLLLVNHLGRFTKSSNRICQDGLPVPHIELVESLIHSWVILPMEKTWHFRLAQNLHLSAKLPCSGVCVFLYFYPATCGPKGHGSGSAAALEQRQ